MKYVFTKHSLAFPKQTLVFKCLQYESFENAVGKGEIARNKQFLIFLQYFLPCMVPNFHFPTAFFLPFWRAFSHFHQICNCCLQMLWVWKRSKFVIWERVKLGVEFSKFKSEFTNHSVIPKNILASFQRSSEFSRYMYHTFRLVRPNGLPNQNFATFKSGKSWTITIIETNMLFYWSLFTLYF